MTTFRVFIATSLDGFIARPDGRLDWLPGAAPDGVPAPAGEDHGFEAFLAGTEVIVMGRATFGAVRDFRPWPYAGRRLLVLSRTLTGADVPEALRAEVTVHPGPPEVLAAELRAQGVGGVYVDGGQTVQAFLRAGLIGELVVTRVPVLLGQGRPLFGALASDVWWDHQGTRAFPSGLVQDRYRRRPAGR
ncbi:dihydrofolate reductase family protein [Deinococcus kurensis]|uniref:dihydrofolate reductase family protein n=1 Tax=Deinococcus kurensis TaxID=2662757 RepID=UPI0012D353E7|nr:dihydrofolate reductase family protein [Deinococcus kurensis]